MCSTTFTTTMTDGFVRGINRFIRRNQSCPHRQTTPEAMQAQLTRRQAKSARASSIATYDIYTLCGYISVCLEVQRRCQTHDIFVRQRSVLQCRCLFNSITVIDRRLWSILNPPPLAMCPLSCGQSTAGPQGGER